MIRLGNNFSGGSIHRFRMSYQLCRKTVFLGILLTGFIDSAEAHNVAVTEDIAGTWHIEPNHSPKAGEPATVWIALTRKGGQILPLEQADCSLKVYSQPQKPDAQPILSPPLKAIAAEQYQGIPGADIIFPTTGLYQLKLACAPKLEGDFTPFQMDYEVTVSSGVTATPQVVPSSEAQTLPTPAASITPSSTAQPSSPLAQAIGLGMGVIAVIVLLGLVRRWLGKR